jgi:hypothetical protein
MHPSDKRYSYSIFWLRSTLKSSDLVQHPINIQLYIEINNLWYSWDIADKNFWQPGCTVSFWYKGYC